MMFYSLLILNKVLLGARMRLAYLISLILSPHMYSAFVSLVYWENMRFSGGLPQLFIMILSLSVIPFALVYIGYLKGDVDIYISEREKRTKYYIGTIASYLSGVSTHLIFGFTEYLFLYLTYLIVGATLLIINFYWKISIHTAGISGPTLVLQLVSNKPYVVLLILLIPVFWARYRLRAHTISQLLAGAFISLIVTYLVYLLCLYLLVQ